MSSIAYSLLLAHLTTLPPSAQQNICLSPYSLQSAFALVQEGAKGKTKKEITRALDTQHFVALPEAEIFDDNSVILEQANSIWINAANAPSIKQSFLDINEKKYHAEVTALPFDEQGKRQINDWCNEKTHGRIPDALDKLSPSDVMELINAIYFKGEWVTEFNTRYTQKADFLMLDESTIQVDMMRNTTRFNYAEDDLCQMVELPFKSSYSAGQDEYVLQIVLPKDGINVRELDEKLADGYNLPDMSFCKVKLALPKFEINYTADLIPTLQNMGMKLPFTSAANFSRISKASLMISTVTQKTFFKVDEQGAEAAAVTSIGMRLTSAAPRPEKVFEMNVDHPFLVKLVNKTRDTTLFIGNIFNPNDKR